MSGHRRGSRLVGVALCCVWVATLAQADTAVTPAMHCQRHMPCCPQGTNENCSQARCAEQVPEKTEAQAEKAERGRANDSRAVPAIQRDAICRVRVEPVRELTAGLQFRATVFRLKDDLRI